MADRNPDMADRNPDVSEAFSDADAPRATALR